MCGCGCYQHVVPNGTGDIEWRAMVPSHCPRREESTFDRMFEEHA